MRESCWTCRNRTIRCDQSRYPCFKCEKAGLECLGKRPLKWVKGVAIRGKMRGRMYEREKALESSHERKAVQSERSQAVLVENSLRFPLQDTRIHGLDLQSRYYLDYYNKRICELYILQESEKNPLRSFISYGLEDMVLLKSITALAARHLANTGHSFDHADEDISPRFVDANLDALLFKKQAVGNLALALTDAEPYRKDMKMATILLLIFLELLESGLDSWNCHLKGAKGLVNVYHSVRKAGISHSNNSDSGEMTQDIRLFISRQFSLIETLGGALSHSKSPSDFSISYEVIGERESIVRSFLGCPEFLLGSIRFFSSQRHVAAGLAPQEDVASHGYIEDTVMMLELTEKFDSSQWASEFQRSLMSSTDKIEKLCMLSEAYKTATLLYGNQVLGTLTAASPNNGELVSQLLALIDALKDRSLFKCLLWPTFVAGLHCQEQDQQGFIIDSLRIIWNLTNCLNAISASNILKYHWEQMKTPKPLYKVAPGPNELDHYWLLI